MIPVCAPCRIKRSALTRLRANDVDEGSFRTSRIDAEDARWERNKGMIDKKTCRGERDGCIILLCGLHLTVLTDRGHAGGFIFCSMCPEKNGGGR
jgi:hypothetical protein